MTFFLISLVATFHIYFFFLERFVWNTPKGLKIFNITKEQAEHSQVLAANQGVYNLFLGLGLVWSLLTSNTSAATPIQFFILIYVFLCGLYGAKTASKRIFFIQSLPAFFALLSMLY